MLFVPCVEAFQRGDTTRTLPGFALDPTSYGPNELAQDVIQAQVGGESYSLLGRVVRQLVAFNEQLEERSALNQDCLVFAAACYTDDKLAGRLFYRFRGFGINAKTTLLSEGPDPIEPDVEPGGVLLTSGLPSSDPRHMGFEGGVHLMVRSSLADPERSARDTLYASKINKRGPVILHTFAGARQAFPQHTIKRVTNLRASRMIAMLNAVLGIYEA